MSKTIPTTTITRDIHDLAEPIGNIYETVEILGKRANQIAIAEKKDLMEKLEKYKSDRDTMEEVFENRQQIEISEHFEKQPKPSLVATHEFENGEIVYRYANKDKE